jgi:hypothetical protein
MKLDCNLAGNIAADADFFTTFDGMRPHQIRLMGGDTSLDALSDP